MTLERGEGGDAAAPAFCRRYAVVAGKARLPLLVYHDDKLDHGRGIAHATHKTLAFEKATVEEEGGEGGRKEDGNRVTGGAMLVKTLCFVKASLVPSE
jgi:hypothetical protein